MVFPPGILYTEKPFKKIGSLARGQIPRILISLESITELPPQLPHTVLILEFTSPSPSHHPGLSLSAEHTQGIPTTYEPFVRTDRYVNVSSPDFNADPEIRACLSNTVHACGCARHLPQETHNQKVLIPCLRFYARNFPFP